MGDPPVRPGCLLVIPWVIPQKSNLPTHVDLGYWLNTSDILDFIRAHPSLKPVSVTVLDDDDTERVDVLAHNSVAPLKCDGMFARIVSHFSLPVLRLLYLNTVIEDDIETAVPFITRSG